MTTSRELTPVELDALCEKHLALANVRLAVGRSPDHYADILEEARRLDGERRAAGDACVAWRKPRRLYRSAARILVGLDQ